MKRALSIVLLLYLAAYILPLDVRPFFSPDETRYAEIPREMLESGDWLVPRLDGVRYFEKPPLGYWVTAVSFLAFGENEFAARLPSAIAAGLTALILMLLASRWYGRSAAGPLAAVVYLTSLLVFIVGTANILDGVFTLFVTGCLASFFHACQERRAAARNWFLALAGACCGLAFLTKGFLAVAIPGMVAVCFLVSERRWRDAFRLAWLPSAAAIAITLPWAVAIWSREPDYWRYFVWVEHVKRFLDPLPSQHPKPLWYLAPVALGSLVLWCPLVGAVISGHRGGTRNPLTRWALWWAVLPFLFLSLAGGKLASYILPCLAPLAILIAAGLIDYFDRQRPARHLLVGSWVSALLALVGLGFVIGADWPGYGEDEIWKRSLVLLGLAWWGIVAVTSALLGNRRSRLWVYCCAPLALLFSAPWIVPQAATNRCMTGVERVLTSDSAAASGKAFMVADRRTIHAACWNLKRSDVHLLNDGGELDYGLGYPDSQRRLIHTDELVSLLASPSRSQDVDLVLTEGSFSKVVNAGAVPTFRTEAGGIVWARFGPGELPVARAGPVSQAFSWTGSSPDEGR